MTVKKEGELRVRKGESIYGPMTRQDFDRLLASGRVNLADFVSVLNGPWTEILQFLSPPPPADQEQGHLRVLRGDRIFGSLNHRRLKQLCAEGRIAGDDLVCAIGGPWMPVANFLAPPRRPEETPTEVEEPDELEAEVEYIPLTWYRVYANEVEEKQADQWYVRVHGIHSAPLTKRQIRQLMHAEEITLGNLARHVTWHAEFWQPIRSIPDLADLLREADAG
jgi:hypothetical protein